MASTQTVMWNQNLWSLTFRRCLACQVLPEDSNRWSPDVTFEPNCLRRALCSYWQVGLATSSRSIQQDVSLNWKRCQDTLFSSENWKTEKQYETFEMKRLHAVYCLPRLSLSGISSSNSCYRSTNWWKSRKRGSMIFVLFINRNYL